MKVLIIGNGGRESAIAWKLSQSPKVDQIYVLPGNAGTALAYENVPLNPMDFDACVHFAKEKEIDLVVVGPEDPLVGGIADAFDAADIAVFGPNKKAAQFEGSKAFTKDFLMRHKIPTAAYKEYKDYDSLASEIDTFGYPVVLKADGLAAGKGVLICENKDEALEAAKKIFLDKAFGAAGDKVVLEAFLTGQEASILCFVDGKNLVPMESAQDYKRAHDHDEGLNTGGMGSYSPNVLYKDKNLIEAIEQKILKPTIDGFIEDGIDFRGVLFIGLMIEKGEPSVLEFNVRFGDPETQSVLSRLDSDLADIMLSCIRGELYEKEIRWSDQSAVSVVLASGGYPEEYKKGEVITGLEEIEDCVIFHAGTVLKDSEVLTNGGRVLAVTATAPTIEEAREKVYAQIDKIQFDDAFYRHDIAEF